MESEELESDASLNTKIYEIGLVHGLAAKLIMDSQEIINYLQPFHKSLYDKDTPHLQETVDSLYTKSFDFVTAATKITNLTYIKIAKIDKGMEE